LNTAFGLGGYTPSLSQLCLQHVRAIDSKTHPLMRIVESRVLAASAVGIGAIEALGHLFLGSAATAVQMMKRITCAVLMGGFVSLWATSGWVNSYLFGFSPVKTTLFFGIQLGLWWSRPKQSYDQLRLWSYIVTQLPIIANQMGSLAYTVDKSVNRVASWNHIQYFLRRCLASRRSARGNLDGASPAGLIQPKKVVGDYESVHPWPKPLYQRVWRRMKAHPFYTTITLSLIAAAVYHYTQPGAEDRQQWAMDLSGRMYRGTEDYAVTVGQTLSTCWDWTGATAWRWWTKAPSAALMKQNEELIQAIKELRNPIPPPETDVGSEELATLRAEIDQLRQWMQSGTCPTESFSV